MWYNKGDNQMRQAVKYMIKVNNHSFKRIAMFMTATVMSTSLLCGCGSQHLEMHYEDNENSNIQEWDNADNDNITDWDSVSITWDDVEDYSDWVYSEALFDDITDEFPVVECKICDFRTNGQYFDGEKVYEMVGDKFDVNSFVGKYATGTGVIIICTVLKIATSSGPKLIACFFAGAADASFSYATKGAAFGAAMGAVKNAIKSHGDIEDTFYGALEDSADGYMWGAIFGAIEGGWNSKFCFTEDTLVTTRNGLLPIKDLSVGDKVYSYDENSDSYQYNLITQVINNTTSELIEISIGDEIIRSTPNHPYLTDIGWVEANDLFVGSFILSEDNNYEIIDSITHIDLDEPINTYNLCIENSHTYLVGNNQLVVHNNCKPNEKYAGDTYHFPEGSNQAKKYPKGVPFNDKGFPDFSQYAEITVKLPKPTVEGYNSKTCLIGNCTDDFRLANQQAGLGDTIYAYLKDYPGYTWHHCEDMQTMMLVPQDVHSVAFGGAAHGGGESLLKELWAALGVV